MVAQPLAAARDRRVSAMGGKHSLDDLVGAGEDRRRDRQAERLRGLQIDNQFEPSRLLHGQVRRLFALQDTSGVSADLSKGEGDTSPVTEQAAGRGKFWPVIDRGDAVV